MGDSESDSEAGEDDNNYALRNVKTTRRTILKRLKNSDLEEGIESDDMTLAANKLDKLEREDEITKPEISTPGTFKQGEDSKAPKTRPRASFQLPKAASAMTSMSNLEQSMPADAVLAKAGAAEVSRKFSLREKLADEMLLVSAGF
jgi:metal transporter CNNM